MSAGSTVVAALEFGWRAIQERHPEVPAAVLITGTGVSGRTVRLGHYRHHGWAARQGDDRTPEVFVSGERLASGAELTMQTLLHESAHALASARDIEDTSRGCTYHNRRFLMLAGEVGLEYAKSQPDRSSGYSAVTLTDLARREYAETIERIDKAIVVHLDTLKGGSGVALKAKAKTKDRNFLKLVCECEPARTIRASRKTVEQGDIRCGFCLCDFLEER